MNTDLVPIFVVCIPVTLMLLYLLWMTGKRLKESQEQDK